MVASYAWAAPEGILSGARDLIGALAGWPIEVQRQRSAEAQAAQEAALAEKRLEAYGIQNATAAASQGVELDPRFAGAAAAAVGEREAAAARARQAQELDRANVLLRLAALGVPVPQAQLDPVQRQLGMVTGKYPETRPFADSAAAEALAVLSGGGRPGAAAPARAPAPGMAAGGPATAAMGQADDEAYSPETAALIVRLLQQAASQGR